MQYFSFCTLGTFTEILTCDHLTFYTKGVIDFFIFARSSLISVVKCSLQYIKLQPHIVASLILFFLSLKQALISIINNSCFLFVGTNSLIDCSHFGIQLWRFLNIKRSTS